LQAGTASRFTFALPPGIDRAARGAQTGVLAMPDAGEVAAFGPG